MKKSFMESLNTTISNSPQTTRYIRSPISSSQTLLKQKTKRTPLTLLDCHWEETHEIDSHDIMSLEIEQLRRENKFLTKKIEEMSVGLSSDQIKIRALLSREKEEMNRKIELLPLTVSFFFEEISNLIETMSKLFRFDLTPPDISRLSQLKEKDADLCPIKKYEILKHFELNRNLQKIMMENESKRFEKLIDLFSYYFKTKEQCDKKLVERVDKMILLVNQLNKSIIQRSQASENKRDADSKVPQKLTFNSDIRGMQMLTKSTATSRMFHQRNQSSITPNNCENEIKFFRRTNKVSLV